MVTFELFNNVGVEGGITVDGVRSFLNANKQNEIQFDISTLGGDLATAITIHDLIKTHPKKTVANIVGLTASAGTVIAIACDEVQMSDNALFLIHNGWRELTGNVYDFQKAAADLMKTDAVMVKMYREKTGMDDNRITQLMKASDWLTPYEAKELGFVDRIVSSGIKIAASVLISGAQGKINDLLLTKLSEKMKLFGKEKAEVKAFPLTLKDGNICVINAEAVAQGVEIAPLGAMTLEDGDYQLADGRTISVAGGVVTNVADPAPAPGTDTEDAILNTVATMLTASEAKIEAMIEAKLKPLAAMVSTHVPAKSAGPANPSQASVEDQLQAKIEAKQAELKAAAEAKRKGGK